MGDSPLRRFVEDLERSGELVRVREPADVLLEISAMADLASKSRAPKSASMGDQKNDPLFHHLGGAALLFEQPRLTDGSISNIPVLINAYGSYSRMARTLHAPEGFDAIGKKIGSLVKPVPPRGFGEAIAKAKEFFPLLKIGPRRKKSRGTCQEVVHEGDTIDLRELPIIRCWPHDGDFAALGYPGEVNAHLSFDPQADDVRGRYITLAGIHTIHADDAGEAKPSSHNIGMYRVQLLSKNRLAMHWHMHHDGASHWRSWKQKGEPMPVAIVLGGEAVLPYAATAPLPPGISELLMAGFLNGKGIEMCRGVSVPLWVPASAEIVIEGFVRTDVIDGGGIGWDPRETDEPLGDGCVFEGPFGDHTGFYSMPDRYPIVEVTAVTMREKPLYPTTVVGLPPQEDYFLGKATERLFKPLLQVLIHDVKDYDLPMFGAFHNCAFVQIDKQYPLQARRVMHAIWGAGQMAWTKLIFVVDGDTDVHDTFAVLRACGEHCLPGRDVEVVRGPLDILDHAAPRIGAGTKLGFDCTRRWAGEDVDGSLIESPAPTGVDEETLLRVKNAIGGITNAAAPEELGRRWLFIAVEKKAGGQGRAALREVLKTTPGVASFVIAVDSDIDLSDTQGVLFRWCANCDASRDLVRLDNAVAIDPIGFDATFKSAGDATEEQPVRAWPPVLEMDAEVLSRLKV
ncbi:MAG: UbiD family decarboxylase domain-containing protein [Planctomycetota bacterium]